MPALDGDLDSEAQELSESLRYIFESNTSLSILSDEELIEFTRYFNKHIEEEKTASEADRKLFKLKEKYQKADIIGALRDANKLIDELEKANNLRTTGQILLDAYLTKALCEWASKKKEEVKHTLLNLLKAHPAYFISDKYFSPQFVELFESARGDLSKNFLGHVDFDTSPAGAEVFLNGVKLCITPCDRATLPEGSYLVDIKTNHYQVVSDSIHIEAGKTNKYIRKLEWELSTASNKGDIRVNEDSLVEKIQKAIAIGKTLKVDRVIFVNTSTVEASRGNAVFRVIDARYGAGRIPYSFRFKIGKSISTKHLLGISQVLYKQIFQDITSDPSHKIDPKGLGDSILLGKKRKKLTKQPAFWVGVGGLALTALLLGIFATGDGGNGNEANQQQTKIKLKIE